MEALYITIRCALELRETVLQDRFNVGEILNPRETSELGDLKASRRLRERKENE